MLTAMAGLGNCVQSTAAAMLAKRAEERPLARDCE